MAIQSNSAIRNRKTENIDLFQLETESVCVCGEGGVLIFPIYQLKLRLGLKVYHKESLTWKAVTISQL